MKSHKNIEYVLTRRSFPDFLKALDHKVDTKEWSEVGGVFHLARGILQKFKPGVIFDIGCGKRPTLAVMMALNFKAPVIAVDPQLDDTLAGDIKRLWLYPSPTKDWLHNNGAPKDSNGALILANHSHVSKREIMELTNLYKTWVYVTVPCCVDNKLSGRMALTYKDVHMHTPKNDVYIYASHKELLKTLM